MWVFAITVHERTWLEPRVYLGLVFFDLLFLITALHHQMHRVIVDIHGMTITGLLQISSTYWRDIIKHERGFGLHFWTRDGGGFSLSPLDTERFDDLVALFTRQRMIPQEHMKNNAEVTSHEKQLRKRPGKHRRQRKS